MRVQEFTEEKFLKEYVDRFKINCSSFLLVPKKENYLDLIHPYILTADNLFYMHFISHETWTICKNLYIDVTERVIKNFDDWGIKPLYERDKKEDKKNKIEMKGRY